MQGPQSVNLSDTHLMLVNLELLPLAVAFVAAFTSVIIMSPVAKYLGLVDAPSQRKQHLGQIPLTGGLAIFFAVLTSSFVADLWIGNSQLYFTAASIIVMLGVFDDKYNLSAQGRLISQSCVGLIMAISANNYVYNLGDLIGLGDIFLGPVGYVFTIVAVVGVINAFNMIDGIDGLAGCVSIVTLSALVILMVIAGNGDSVMRPLIILAAILPFLAFNMGLKGFRGNKIFMGDSGSMFVGLSIVWLLVDSAQGDAYSLRPVTAVWLIGLPLIDMGAIMYRRIRKGQSPLQADTEHLHYICMRAGLTSKQALAAITMIAIVFAAFGILGEVLNLSEATMFTTFVVVQVLYCILIQNIWKVLRFFREDDGLPKS